MLTTAATAIAVATRGSAHFVAGAGWGLANIALRNIIEKRPRVAWVAMSGLGMALTGLVAGRLQAKRKR